MSPHASATTTFASTSSLALPGNIQNSTGLLCKIQTRSTGLVLIKGLILFVRSLAVYTHACLISFIATQCERRNRMALAHLLGWQSFVLQVHLTYVYCVCVGCADLLMRVVPESYRSNMSPSQSTQQTCIQQVQFDWKTSLTLTKPWCVSRPQAKTGL